MAGDREHGPPVRLERRQRLARRRSLGRAELRSRSSHARRRALRADAVGRVLQPGRPAGGLMHGVFFDATTVRKASTAAATSTPPDVWLTNPPLRHDRLGDPDHLLPGDHDGPGSPGALLRGVADVPRDVRLGLAREPAGRETRTYLGIEVFEGAYTYRGMRVVPGWGGSMFEELMPNVFVPEETWAPRSWGVNHHCTSAPSASTVSSSGYGYWGFSPASNPTGGYRSTASTRSASTPRATSPTRR